MSVDAHFAEPVGFTLVRVWATQLRNEQSLMVGVEQIGRFWEMRRRC